MYIKGFDKDLKCRGMQFQVGGVYEIGGGRRPELCTDTVFHFCNKLKQVHSYYDVRDEMKNRFCEIEPLGEVVTDDEKCGSNKIHIVREIVGDELENMRNTGSNNTGLFNTGDLNTGDRNTGCRNTGYSNTGYSNTGDSNTGYRNTGCRNTGDSNTGYSNTGCRNTGYSNTGDLNTGDRNTGGRNTGDSNTGIFNTCNYSSGIFCTVSPKVMIFNCNTDMTMAEFLASKYAKAIYSVSFSLCEWVYYTDDEKQDDAEKKRTEGYLKQRSFFEACELWWDSMTEENRRIIMSMPNFDKAIFKEITGVAV